jgi:predicted permease
MLSDLRQAVRGFRQTPLFAAVAVLTLTLAIGANTAIFSLVDALLLRDLPVRDPRSLVQLATVNAQTGLESGFTYSLYRDLAVRQQPFSALIGWSSNVVLNLAAGDRPARGAVSAVSGNFYAELGIQPALGRLVGADDVNEAAETPALIAVLGHAFWRRQFGGDPGVIGRPILVEDRPFTIVGVAPETFRGLTIAVEPDVSVPLTAYPLVTGAPSAALRSSTSTWVRVTGRLKPGVAIEQARASLDTIWPDLKSANVPAGFTGARRDHFLATRLATARASTGIELGRGLRTRFAQPLVIVFAIALLVLSISCVNLASLMLARAAGRGHEIGVRLALGAGRWQVAQQLIVEGVLLSAAGAACGVWFAYWSSAAMVGLILRDYTVPATLDVRPDARIVAFTAALASLVGVLFSAVPAWWAGRQDASASLRSSARTTSGVGRTGRMLVAVQVALSLVLIVNAGLLIRSLGQVRAVPLGMQSRNVIVAYPGPRPGGYRNVDNDSYYPAVVARLEAVPGVQRAAVSNFKPAGGGTGGGEPVSSVATPADAGGAVSMFMSISPGLFDALGMPIQAGRDFTWSDGSHSRRVAIVSATLARTLFPAGDAIGQRVRSGVLPRRQDLEIVGVVADAHLYDLKDPNLAALYTPSLQEPDIVDGKCFVVRGAGVSVAALQHAVDALGVERFSNVQPVDDIVDRVLLQDRVTAVVAGFFGALAMLLAAIGLYGLMSYEVSRRRREIGIRMALGAVPARVVRTVVGDGLAVAGAGAAAGLAASVITVRLVKALLFGIGAHDTLTMVAAPALLVTIAAIACVVPAARAARTEPMIALRAE